MRRMFAILLSFFFVLYGNPMFAAKKKEPTKHYLPLNENPVSPERKVDWSRECLLKTMYDEHGIYGYKKGGRLGHVEGDTRRGTPYVIDKFTREPLWVYNCGNGIEEGFDRNLKIWLLAKDWRPKGILECAPIEYRPVPSVNTEPSPKPIRLQTSPPKYRPVPKVAPPFLLEVELLEEKPPITLGIKKEKSFWHSPWPYVIGGVLVGGAIYAICSSRSKGKSSQPTGGPSPDPPNGPSGGPPN